MSLPPNLRAHVEAYQGLVALRGRRPLSDEESQRLELLRDLLLEAQVALDQAEGLPRKTVRAPLQLDVSFVTPNDAARAFAVTHDIGTGGMSFRTALELPKGSMLALTITIPGWPRPIDASAEVMWCRGGAVGLAFRGLDPAVEQRVKTLVTEHSSFLDRLGVSLGAPKKPAQPLVTERLKVVLVRLRETTLAENTTQAVKAAGFAVLLPTADAKPVAIVGDSSSALEMTEKFPGVPLVLVHVSGPESLVGRLSRLVPAAFIPRPATEALILEALGRVVVAG